MKFIAFFFVLLGSALMYCTHPNQIILKRPLTSIYRWFGLGAIILALILFLISVPKLVAIFMWLLTMLIVWSFFPFISLMIKKSHS
ncbi:hypothetical protein F7P75_03675 [Acinetobacter gandensis]|nr:hypothetical protein F7P75_03675 [Acinetobacter gandensis]